MEEKLTKELAEKLMKIKGECRGICLKTDWESILKREGKEGLKKLEEKMAELGYPIKYETIKTMDFYPLGLDVISILAIKEIFNYDEKDLEELGALAVKSSLILRIFLKYFFSLSLLAKQAPEIWRKHYTVGDLEVSEINEKEKYIIIRLKDFSSHPSFCVTLKGYFSQITKMATRRPVTCQETKCTFKGDEYHEFLLKW